MYLWPALIRIYAGDRCALVSIGRHEIRKPRDLEDLPVVLAQVTGQQLAPLRARPRQQTDDQRNARAVDVADAAKVEEHRPGAVPRGFRVGGLQGRFLAAVDVAGQNDDGDAVVETGCCLQRLAIHAPAPSSLSVSSTM